MADRGSTTRECPFCREEVRADALRCKHCQAAIAPERPDHAGTCPFCKEQVKPDAIRCKHCHADLSPGARLVSGGCAGCGGAAPAVRYAGRGGTSALGTRRAVPKGTRLSDQNRLVGGNLDALLFPERRVASDSGGCPPLDSDDVGIWVYVAENETDCFYELVVEWHPSPYSVFR